MGFLATFKAVVIGWLVDVVGTKVGTYLAMLAFAVIWVATGRSLDRIDQLPEPLLLAVSYLVCGLLFTVLGAYVTAILAQREKVRHALGMGFLSELTGLVYIALSPRSAPTWYLIVGSGLVLPAALAGGWLGAVLGGRGTAPRPSRLAVQVIVSTSVLTFLLTVSMMLAVFPRGGG